jgi:hypothetical protein
MLYQETLQAVENGAIFKVNFQDRSLKVNGKYVIKDGEYEGDLGVNAEDNETILSTLETLYDQYRHSIPSARSRSRYFIALKEEALDDDDMLFGESREPAQVKLELYLLCQIILGMKWSDSFGKWFWRSQKHKDLIVLKNWIENK